jgi:hypothetical protein
MLTERCWVTKACAPKKSFSDWGLMRDSNSHSPSYAQITTKCAISADRLIMEGPDRDMTKQTKKRGKKHRAKKVYVTSLIDRGWTCVIVRNFGGKNESPVDQASRPIYWACTMQLCQTDLTQSNVWNGGLD